MITIYSESDIKPAEILRRDNSASGLESVVSEILSNVRKNGDSALFEYCERFDGGAPERLEVTREEIDAAYTSLAPELLSALNAAAENIRDFHKRQKREGFIVTEENGKVLGQKIMPLQRVGLYIPGGTACYPSTVLMNCIPAKIAGVAEIIITSPAKNGVISPLILAAAKIAGADRVFRIGGAQAIAALSYGTESVPAVDKITGPGNVFVAEAKRQVYGLVDIDMIAGPSEILIIADRKSKAEFIAADLLSQAEHDKNASAILVTTSMRLAFEVQQAIEVQLKELPRAEIARESIDKNGKIIITESIEAAIEIANEISPEHLELCVESPFDYLDQIRSAGSIFLGRYCPEALGDYFAGPNHTLPTNGTARFSSPLSVDDFIKKSSFIYYTKSALESVGEQVIRLAECEGLHAHGKSVSIRTEGAE